MTDLSEWLARPDDRRVAIPGVVRHETCLRYQQDPVARAARPLLKRRRALWPAEGELFA